MRPPHLLLSLAAAAASSLTAQVPFDHAVVATRLAGTPRTQLLLVDVQTGTTSSVGRFPSDGLAPLEVAIDPINRDVIVALDFNGGITHLVRLGLSGASVASERFLAQIAGTVTGLTVAWPGDVYATVDGGGGGLYRIPRNGGSATRLAALPHASAMTKDPFVAGGMMITQSAAPGPGGVDPTLVVYDAFSGIVARYPWPGHNPSTITGVIDLPTTVPKQYLTHADGTVSWSFGFQTPQLQVMTPVLPPGATVAAHSDATYSRFYVLGGASHPYLKTLGLPGYPQTWQNVAGPFPGDPVDFDFEHGPVELIQWFGEHCGSSPLLLWVQGPGTVGSTTFGLGIAGIPAGTSAFLVLGASEQQTAGVPLPAPIPGGCQLLVSLDVVVGHTAGAPGNAFQRIPIPNLPSLIGQSIFGQWLALSGTPFEATHATAVRIGP